MVRQRDGCSAAEVIAAMVASVDLPDKDADVSFFLHAV